MKKIQDLDYQDQERVRALRSVLHQLKRSKQSLERLDAAGSVNRAGNREFRIVAMNEEIEKAEKELHALLDDRLPSEELGG